MQIFVRDFMLNLSASKRMACSRAHLHTPRPQYNESDRISDPATGTGILHIHTPAHMKMHTPAHIQTLR